MAFLRKKGKYFYLVKSVWIDGKPSQEVVEYLGKPDDALKKAEALGLSEAMLQQIRDALPPRRFYLVSDVDDEGRVGDHRICKMSDSEAEEFFRKFWQ